jgi:folate-binding protein YgfZ
MEKWTEALQRAGLNLASGQQVMDFGDPASERLAVLDQDVISDLSQFGLIEAGGGEAQKFLQGQFTNDVRKVDGGHAQLNAWCSAKGRVLVNFWLFQRGGKYYLMLPADSVERVLKRLRMYVLRSDVQLRDASAELGRMGLSGPRAESLLRERLGQAPAEIYACAETENLTVFRVPGPLPRFVLIGEGRALMGQWAGLAAEAKPVGLPAWNLLDILAGLPWIGTALAEEFVPQMLNLQALDGVSFNKGCYPGQEIVARSQYLGSVKRRLYLARCTGETCPRTGATLPTIGGEEAGQVVAAQPHPQGGCLLLAVLRIEMAEQCGLAFSALPYQAALEAK